MAVIILVYLVGGSFIDDLAFIILATPIFFPIMVKLGYDPIWVCIMIALTNCLGVVLPPVAITVFVVKQITKTPIWVIYSGVYPFLISMAICMILMFVFPRARDLSPPPAHQMKTGRKVAVFDEFKWMTENNGRTETSM